MTQDHGSEDSQYEEESSVKLELFSDTDRSSSDTSDVPGNGILRVTNDLESQQPIAPEHNVPLRSKLIFLGLYFFLNLFLTLSNKTLLGQAKLPWLLTAAHTSATSLGCFAMLGARAIELTELGRRENLILVAFSFLFTINIAISNVSLAMVSVPFHQIMRSTCPVVTILLYRFIYGRTYSTQTYLTMIPLIFGVALSTAGDYYFTVLGFFMTALGVILASAKTVASNRLMTGTLKLSAPELLLRMSPLAAVQCVLYAILSGEADQFRIAYSQGEFSKSFALALVINATAAFLLNIVGFQTNKMAGALTVTVCGNVKQALTILLGIVIFHVEVGMMNATGMAITIAGAVWYSKVELDNKRAQHR